MLQVDFPDPCSHESNGGSQPFLVLQQLRKPLNRFQNITCSRIKFR